MMLIRRNYLLMASILKITLLNLRENCSVVSQQVHLFNDTVTNNIAHASADKYSREEIVQTATAAHAIGLLKILNMD